MKNQREWIYNYMVSHGSITPMECFEKLRITKLFGCPCRNHIKVVMPNDKP